MSDVKKIFGMKETPIVNFVNPARQSIEQTEDYATKQVIKVKELLVYANSKIKLFSSNGTNFSSIENSKTDATDEIRIRNAGITKIVINANGFGLGSVDPTTKAIFIVQSTSQGSICAPKMTEAQKNAIAAPPEGLQVYDTTLHKLCVYTGAAWETITSA